MNERQEKNILYSIFFFLKKTLKIAPIKRTEVSIL